MFEKIYKKFYYAFRGIKEGFVTENTLKFHLIVGIIVIIFSLLLKLNEIEFVVVFLLIGLVIVTEMINTIFEIFFRHIYKEKSYYARVILDISAGAVLITSVFSVIIGFIIFLPKVLAFILPILHNIGL